MARSSRPSTSKPTRTPDARAKANAAGYLKRRSTKAPAARVEDDGAEDDRHRGDSEDEDGEERAPRLMGEGDTIESGDDEEIDSDAAFEDVDGDADGFAGVFGRKNAPKKNKKTKARAVRFADVDLNEDADVAMGGEDEEDLDSDTYIDILDVLDGKASPDYDDIDTSPAALTALHALISSLPAGASVPPPSAKRKAPADADASAPRKKRALRPALAERTQAGAEGEFHVSAGGGVGGSKLSLADLLAPLAAPLPGVQKSLAAAPSASSKEKDKAKSKSGKKVKPVGGGALPAPLPLRTQARVDREAAYEATKEEVDKWTPSMKRIREAEHLSFPLQGAAQERLGRPSSAALAATFTPRTELETGVARLLNAAHLAQDADVQRTENTLLAATLDPAEVARRRGELRMMRELAFRGEAKARRVAKIKSKVYRKIARGRKERAGVAGEEREGGEEDAMQREVDRARVRAGMRVKRNAGWNRARVQGEAEDDLMDGEGDGEVLGGRRAMERELERGERLARLIRGEGDDSQESDSDSEDDADDGADGADGEARVRRRAFDELRMLKDGVNDKDGEGEVAKGVFGMKFMRDGIARREAEAGRDADDFVKEMGIGGEESGDEEGDTAAGVITQRTGGRVTLRPGTTRAPPRRLPRPHPRACGRCSPPPTSNRGRANPWLAATSSSGPKAPRAKNAVIVSKDSKAADKARHRLAKDGTKLGKSAVAAARDDGVVEIEVGKVLGDDGEANQGEDDDANSEVDAQETALVLKKQKGKGKAVKAFEQRDLVALAFAGDNVVRDFEDAKRREIASDAPRVVDTTLPGWGAWGGPATRKHASKPKPHLLKHVPGIAPAARADHGKAHVIISEKRDKKAAKYQVADLPYPFTSRAQYERSMEAPLGAEWNTRVGFQRGTLPRVVKKMGMVIEPLAKLL
ncbi:Utp14 protein-domain-containing protein [Mycena rosella]|uniref:Utp14 protein-domain-containing protein n=1 Tax=Mycena rosella TaxID=1033263 RepID=A0AAD7BQH9_MYCRO|nr:Utp14 protein-domain-containing protein [Mycena rosella]